MIAEMKLEDIMPRNKPGTKGQILYDWYLQDEALRIVKLIEIESQKCGYQGQGGGE